MIDNKRIAEFMGALPTRESEYEMYGVIESIEDGEDVKHFFLPSEMLFETSWDWLMLVVIKIMRDEASVNDEYREYLCHVLPYGHKDVIYNAAVAFIQSK